MIRMHKMKKHLTSTVLYVAGVIILYVASLFIPDKGASGELTLADAAKVSLDYYLEISKLVGSLSIALVGGCGALVIKGRDWSTHWTRLDATAIVFALLAAAASLYGVYLGHIAVLQMTIERIFDPFQSRLSAALAIQYYGLVVGVLLLGLVFTRMLAVRKDDDGAAQ